MEMRIERCKAMVTRRLVVALIAVLAVGSVATFNFTKSAKAAAPAPAAAPLDDNSVGSVAHARPRHGNPGQHGLPRQ